MSFGENEENQATICNWADQTFGKANVTSSYKRVLQEFEELQEAFHAPGIYNPGKLAAECADVLITLYRLAEVIGCDLHDEVDKKMRINRNRTWKSNGDGTGQHVRDAIE